MRSETQSPADSEWFVSHGAGCLASYAARQRLSTFDLAAAAYLEAMRAYWNRNDFADAYAVRSIQLGFVNLEDESDEPADPSLSQQKAA